MKRLIFIVCMSLCMATYGQNTFKAIIKDNDSNETLIGATAIIKDTSIGGVADLNGVLQIHNIPNGKHSIVFSYVGYETVSKTYTFPLTNDTIQVILLEEGEEMEEVIISATRSSRTIQNTPTRVEAVTEEELTEKAVMNSTNISMILRESTGIVVQQTSANSGNQSLRIQGLDGRYTQLLKDGFPLYNGFSSGLSVMQVPPLDLKQVEIIKGSSSTLYGGGAIAGLINLVSRQPEEEREMKIMLNQTSALGSTINGFMSDRNNKFGYTLYVSGNNQTPYDPNNDGFSDIPKVNSYSINPKIFYYPSDSTKVWFGVNTSFENRIGGDIEVINGTTNSQHQFSEQNLSDRISTQFSYETTTSKGAFISAKNSVSTFNRTINIPNYSFNGNQIASFTELLWAKEYDKSDWKFGGNVVTDRFTEDQSSLNIKDYNYSTVGIFSQSNWDLSKRLILESGFRLDYNNNFGLFPLPRLALLVKANDNLSMRLGGGLGYKLPTIFTEQSEIISFQGVQPINIDNVKSEKSNGLNLDFNYKTIIADKISFSINQLFFYTNISNSLLLEVTDNLETFAFHNADGLVESKGIETNVKFRYGDFKLFMQYSFTDVTVSNNNITTQKPLTPKHNAGSVLMYEVEEKWRIGYEVYYIGEQTLSSSISVRDYWMMGLMVYRDIKNLSLFLNFENFTDTRQTKYESIVSPPLTNPSFNEIWAPTDGFVTNIGLILNL